MLLAENITHFSRLLRHAGLQVGPDRVLAGIGAVEQVGVERRDDVHAALSAVMLDRHEQQHIFDAAFDAFWRDPRLLAPQLQALQAGASAQTQPAPAAQPQRLAEALAAPRPRDAMAQDEPSGETQFTASARERLQQADFGSMSADEYRWARHLAERLPPPVQAVRLRRHQAAAGGRINLRRSLQRMARQPHMLLPAFTRAQRALPPIVVLLDISGSMDRYARLFLHYVHGLMRRHARVHVFTFGTRLTNITRCLRGRDPDVALQRAEGQVSDWKGGTRIAAALQDFNRHWARRVLGANAAVLLVSDGLDHDDGHQLGLAAAHLHRLAHQLVWLNPLLRFDGFQPRATGVRALLPHVDRFLPVHNLASLADLAGALRTGSVNPASLLRPSSKH